MPVDPKDLNIYPILEIPDYNVKEVRPRDYLMPTLADIEHKFKCKLQVACSEATQAYARQAIKVCADSRILWDDRTLLIVYDVYLVRGEKKHEDIMKELTR